MEDLCFRDEENHQLSIFCKPNKQITLRKSRIHSCKISTTCVRMQIFMQEYIKPAGQTPRWQAIIPFLYVSVVNSPMVRSRPRMFELLISSSRKTCLVCNSIPQDKQGTLKRKSVIISHRWFIAGPNAKHFFTGLLMLPAATPGHRQPWNKDRERLGFVSLRIKSPIISQPDRNFSLVHVAVEREREGRPGSQVCHYSLSSSEIKIFFVNYSLVFCFVLFFYFYQRSCFFSDVRGF